jgi:hypothetical protein
VSFEIEKLYGFLIFDRVYFEKTRNFNVHRNSSGATKERAIYVFVVLFNLQRNVILEFYSTHKAIKL